MMAESLVKIFQQHSFLCKVFAIAIDLIVIATVVYIREGISSRLIERSFEITVNTFSLKLIKEKKWLPCCSYNLHKNFISTHIDSLRTELDLHSSNYQNFVLPGDFNSEMTDTNLKDFCNLYLLKNLKFRKISKLLISY